MVIFLSYIAACFNLAGVYFIGNMKRRGFIFFLIAGLLWSIIAINTGLYGLLLEAVPLAILNVIAYKKWSR